MRVPSSIRRTVDRSNNRRVFTRALAAFCAVTLASSFGCQRHSQPHLKIGSKFFTEQVVLAELLAQHIESRLGVPVERKSNLGGTLLCHKALLSAELDLYVEYTGTALTAVLNELPSKDSREVYERVKRGYEQRLA